MALPNSKSELITYCKRKLGWPVIEINLADEQLEDRIDEAIKYFHDYHMDGSEKIYFKYKIDANNHPAKLHSVKIANGGGSYNNSDVLVFSGGGGVNASANIVTNSNGTIVSIPVSDRGDGYAMAPNVSITTSTGSNANLIPELGGFIEIPDNIIGTVNIFDIGTAINSSADHMFSVRYQIALNDLWTLSSVELAPYYMAMHHLRVIEEILVGKQPLRYNRYRNRLHVDIDWNKMVTGTYVVAECYEIVDPNLFSKVWQDKWVMEYATALIKLNWGEALSKFGAMPMPGGITFNGQTIKEEAKAEVDALRYELINTYSPPPQFYIG